MPVPSLTWITLFRPSDDDVAALRMKTIAKGLRPLGMTLTWIHPRESMPTQDSNDQAFRSVPMRTRRPMPGERSWTKFPRVLALTWEFTRAGCRALAESPENRVVVTYPDTWVLATALILARIRPGRLILDLHDPVLHQAIHPRGRVAVFLLRMLERQLYPRTRAVIVASPGIAEYVSNASRIETVYFGYDSEERKRYDRGTPAWGQGPVRLFYGGTYYGSRSPEPILQGMATLLSRDPALRGQISFHSYSRFATRDDENRARDLARSLGLEDSVEFLPLIPRVQFMEKAASEATHLALITHQSESDYAIPGKIFDYITLGKPTFAVTSDTNLRNFLAHHEIPSYVSRHDPDSIAEALARLCRDWRGPATQAQDRTTALSGTEMARKILELN